MGSEYTLKIPATQAKELPMVDLAFELLKSANTPFYYRDLMMEIAKIKGFSDEDVMQVIAQLYTEINVDGRFACVGNNLWGLKRWYPVDNKSDEMGGGTKRPRIINDEDDDLDEEDYTEEEETYTAEEDDFDSYDTEREDIATEEEEEDIFGEEEIEEEESEEIDADSDSAEDGEEEDADYDDEDDDEEEDEKK